MDVFRQEGEFRHTTSNLKLNPSIGMYNHLTPNRNVIGFNNHIAPNLHKIHKFYDDFMFRSISSKKYNDLGLGV
jgi:hypothetical protein